MLTDQIDINDNHYHFDLDKKVLFNAQSTLLDHPNKVSLIAYTRTCNFKCYGCHNMKHLKHQENLNAFSLRSLINMLQDNFFDLFIMSGGECTLDVDIISMLYLIKHNTKVPVRIDSNGTKPTLISMLKDWNLIDGVALDIKYPYWKGISNVLTNVIGCNTTTEILQNISKTIDIVDGMPYTLYRTVQYPVLPESYIDDIRTYMHKFKSPHYINKYYDL